MVNGILHMLMVINMKVNIFLVWRNGKEFTIIIGHDSDKFLGEDVKKIEWIIVGFIGNLYLC